MTFNAMPSCRTLPKKLLQVLLQVLVVVLLRLLVGLRSKTLQPAV